MFSLLVYFFFLNIGCLYFDFLVILAFLVIFASFFLISAPTDVTVEDSLAPCRINAGSVCNPGTAAAEAEEQKIDKYKDLVNDGYLFKPLDFEIQGAASPSTKIF